MASLLNIAAIVYLVVNCLHGYVKAQENGDLRLVGGSSIVEGRVEIYYGGQWGTVCDDRFGLRDANVVCRQLGFEKATEVHDKAKFGRGSGIIWMDGVECTGNEAELQNCPFNNWGINDCSHGEDVGVVCTLPNQVVVPTKKGDFQVRLSCPPKRSNRNGDCRTCYDKEGCAPISAGVKGIVEVRIDDKWHPISGKDWNIQKAKVVCGQLGFPATFKIPSISEIWPTRTKYTCSGGAANCKPAGVYRQNLRTTALDSLLCTGLESNISSCSFTSLNVVTGPGENVATVHCGYGNSENSEHCGNDGQKEVL